MHQADLPQRVSVGNKTVRIQQRLGKGAFGVVYKVKDESSYEVYALKDVLCLNASALRNALRQASALSQILHKNLITMSSSIVKVYTCCFWRSIARAEA